MDLQTAINNPLINVFDIIPDPKSKYGFSVHTYRKPGEIWEDWHERDMRNFQKAIELKKAG